jgi:hypothetical protein
MAAARIAELLMWTTENRARYNRDHPRYPSDLTDAEWIEIAPLIAPARGGGRRREVDVRNLVNGVTNVLSTAGPAGNPTRALETAPPPLSEA